MTDADLLALNKIGWLPGPGEDEASFEARVQKGKEHFEKTGGLGQAHWEWAREHLEELFDVKPLYIGAFYSKRGLAPWQGAATFVEGREVRSIQLHPRLRKGSHWFTDRGEVLAHEAIHALRSGFEESWCEEFFAFMASSKKYRRVLGPIIQRPWEVWPLFLILLIAPFWPEAYLAASIWIGLGFARLIRGHYILKRVFSFLLKKGIDAKKARAVFIRLSKEEIEKMYRGVDVFEEKRSEPRWKILQNYIESGKAC